MAADHLQLQVGTRLLHIGPHKTGTTAIQGAFHLARERLADAGVVYPGTGRQPLRSILAVTSQPALMGESRPRMAHWDYLVREVHAAGARRVVVSSEFFAEADDEAIRRVVDDLGGPLVHVVVTLRPLTRILPSQWQQYMQNGYCMPYLEWLEGILSDPPRTPTPGFWVRHRHDRLITRWLTAVGPQNLTVVVVDESDRLMLLRTFESLVGLPAGFLKPEKSSANRSLTLGEAELARLINEEFKRREWPVANYAAFMRYGALKQMKTRQPAEDEQRIVTPPWARYRAAEIGAEMARNIAALGVRVIGDLAELGRPPDSLAQAEEDDWPAHALIPAEAAVRALVGAFIAGGVDGQAEADAAPVAPAAPARQAAPSPRQASPATQQPSPRQPVPPARQAAPSLTQASPAAQPAVLQQALPQQAPLQPDPSPPDPPQSDPPQSDPAPARPESRRAPQHASRPVDARGLSRVLAGLRRPRTRNTQRLSR
ncbi:MAG TPA: hypothetical protein VH480_16650 [Streptosporangiaceae bacterium]